MYDWVYLSVQLSRTSAVAATTVSIPGQKYVQWSIIYSGVWFIVGLTLQWGKLYIGVYFTVEYTLQCSILYSGVY